MEIEFCKFVREERGTLLVTDYVGWLLGWSDGWMSMWCLCRW